MGGVPAHGVARPNMHALGPPGHGKSTGWDSRMEFIKSQVGSSFALREGGAAGRYTGSWGSQWPGHDILLTVAQLPAQAPLLEVRPHLVRCSSTRRLRPSRREKAWEPEMTGLRKRKCACWAQAPAPSVRRAAKRCAADVGAAAADMPERRQLQPGPCQRSSPPRLSLIHI